ncbi:hypothetical protein [endosymbiont of Tevnia jerichonana]|nr:hypothetical protein [endosymbiont of Tevnia jerichonana]
MKESMCKLGIILLLLLLASFAVSSAEPLETILAVSPDKAVENALARGDKSLIKVPSCFEMVPGYMGGPPIHRAKLIWGSCEELFGKENYKK